MSFTSDIKMGTTRIGAGSSPFLIAEMSGNHNGSLERALAIVDAMANTGAHALKIQTYTPDTMTIDLDSPRFRVSDEHDLWGGRNLYSLYRAAQTPLAWHQPIFDRARSHGLIPFSTPFDPSAVQQLEDLNVQLYKTASAEIVDLPLIREIAQTGKPMIISTGMASLSEIEAALHAARDAGCTEIVLLACTAAYPASPSDARLANIPLLHDAFGVPVGLSDHTLGIGVAIAAVAMGAVCVEKHVTLSREDGGVDSAFSLTPSEFASLSDESNRAILAVNGPAHIGPTQAELPVVQLRRSLCIVEDVRAGDEVTTTNVRSIRPSGGLPPDAMSTVLGRRFSRDATKGTPLTWQLL